MKLTMEEQLKRLQSVKQSITAHPDCEEGTEFADMVESIWEVMNSIKANRLQELTKKFQTFHQEDLNTKEGRELMREMNDLRLDLGRQARNGFSKFVDL